MSHDTKLEIQEHLDEARSSLQSITPLDDKEDMSNLENAMLHISDAQNHLDELPYPSDEERWKFRKILEFAYSPRNADELYNMVWSIWETEHTVINRLHKMYPDGLHLGDVR